MNTVETSSNDIVAAGTKKVANDEPIEMDDTNDVQIVSETLNPGAASDTQLAALQNGTDENRTKKDVNVKSKDKTIIIEDDDIPVVIAHHKVITVSNGNMANVTCNSSTAKASTSRPISSKSHQQTRFKCLICSKDCHDKRRFQAHQKYDHEMWYRCSDCFKRFKNPGSLVSHLKKHDDKYPFYCSHCLQGFRNESVKQDHEQNCKKCPYKCTFCKKFISLNVSMLSLHTYRCKVNVIN